MPSISKVAIQMVILFVLVCAWAVTSGWKHQVMNLLEISHTGEASFILGTKEHVDISSTAGVYAQTSGTDIDPAASIAE